MKKVALMMCVMMSASFVIAQDVQTVKDESLPTIHGTYAGEAMNGKVVSGVQGTNGWQYTVELKPQTHTRDVQVSYEQNLLPRAQVTVYRGNHVQEAKNEIMQTVATRQSDIKEISGEGGDNFKVVAAQGSGHYQEGEAPVGEVYSVSMKDGYTVVTHYMGFNQNGHWDVKNEGNGAPNFDNKELVQMAQTLSQQKETSGSFIRESDGSKGAIDFIQKNTGGKIKL